MSGISATSGGGASVDLDPNVRENIVDDLIEEEMQLLH